MPLLDDAINRVLAKIDQRLEGDRRALSQRLKFCFSEYGAALQRDQKDPTPNELAENMKDITRAAITLRRLLGVDANLNPSPSSVSPLGYLISHYAKMLRGLMFIANQQEHKSTSVSEPGIPDSEFRKWAFNYATNRVGTFLAGLNGVIEIAQTASLSATSSYFGAGVGRRQGVDTALNQFLDRLAIVWVEAFGLKPKANGRFGRFVRICLCELHSVFPENRPESFDEREDNPDKWAEFIRTRLKRLGYTGDSFPSAVLCLSPNDRELALKSVWLMGTNALQSWNGSYRRVIEEPQWWSSFVEAWLKNEGQPGTHSPPGRPGTSNKGKVGQRPHHKTRD